jgi:hypothetical protein
MQVGASSGRAEVALVVGEALELVIVLSVILLDLALLVGIQKWSGLT